MFNLFVCSALHTFFMFVHVTYLLYVNTNYGVTVVTVYLKWRMRMISINLRLRAIMTLNKTSGISVNVVQFFNTLMFTRQSTKNLLMTAHTTNLVSLQMDGLIFSRNHNSPSECPSTFREVLTRYDAAAEKKTITQTLLSKSWTPFGEPTGTFFCFPMYSHSEANRLRDAICFC